MQTTPTLGLKGCKDDLHWACWVPIRVLLVVMGRRGDGTLVSKRFV